MAIQRQKRHGGAVRRHARKIRQTRHKACPGHGKMAVVQDEGEWGKRRAPGGVWPLFSSAGPGLALGAQAARLRQTTTPPRARRPRPQLSRSRPGPPASPPRPAPSSTPMPPIPSPKPFLRFPASALPPARAIKTTLCPLPPSFLPTCLPHLPPKSCHRPSPLSPAG